MVIKKLFLYFWLVLQTVLVYAGTMSSLQFLFGSAAEWAIAIFAVISMLFAGFSIAMHFHPGYHFTLKKKEENN